MSTFSIPTHWINKRLDIALIGCGGTGSEVIDELYRIHFLLLELGGNGLHVTAFDPDTVSASNIGRQRFWAYDVGQPKAEVLINRLNNFGGVHWSFKNEEFPTSAVGDFDLLISCVDSPQARVAIGESLDDESVNQYGGEVLWMDCGNDSHQGNVVLGHLIAPEEGMVLPNVYQLYPSLKTMPHIPEDSCSTEEAITRQDYGINRSVAREAGNLLWQLLRKGSIHHHCSYIDIREGVVNPIGVNPEQWALFGYQPNTSTNQNYC